MSGDPVAMPTRLAHPMIGDIACRRECHPHSVHAGSARLLLPEATVAPRLRFGASAQSVHPGVDLVDIEAQQAAHLAVRDPSLEDESSDVPDGEREVFRDSLNPGVSLRWRRFDGEASGLSCRHTPASLTAPGAATYSPRGRACRGLAVSLSMQSVGRIDVSV